MRVGVLTSYEPHEIGIAWATVPLMKRYCRIRGYSLVVGVGMSPEGMFDSFAEQFETAMLFLPIRYVIRNPTVRIEHGGKRQTQPPFGLGSRADSLSEIRELARRAA